MKKHYMKFAVITACAACMSLAGCQKEKENDSDDGVYTLPPSLTEDEIKLLSYEAYHATKSAKKGTMVGIADASVANSVANFKYQDKIEEAYDADAKKRVELNYIVYQGQTKLMEFSYLEGTDLYYYSFSPDSPDGQFYPLGYNNLLNGVGTTTKEIRKATTDAAEYYCGVSNNVISSNGDMKLENGKLVWIEEEEYSDEYRIWEYEVVLNASKQYKQIKGKGIVDWSKEKVKYDVECSFTYGAATPALPSGFSKSDFADKRSEYNSFRVIWGEGKGENTFWVKGNNCNLNVISNNAPAVAGKKIASCTVGGKTYTLNFNSDYSYPGSVGSWSPDYIEVSNNSTEVMVTWKAQ
ncbi:MAG: hypothetical protein LBH84_02285 [Prevotellaceae bacterium]|jgi:hypothetical protein|nr:hypothetical protein [Prevotellaceae bacterium]